MVHLEWIKYSRYFQSFKIVRYWYNSENSCLIQKRVETKNGIENVARPSKKKPISAMFSKFTWPRTFHFILI